LPSSNPVNHGTRIQQRIQLTQAYEMMDDCVKKAVIARLYGYSWSEIAKMSQLKEQNLVMRVQYAFRKIREFASRGSKPNGS
jgi:DNA-directed RNA polymerase specialized sigma24 family protein